MSFPIAVIIMLIAGISGGTVNYLLPSNEDAQRSRIRNWIQCVLLGTGATILVPLFLEIAQSKLLDQIHLGYGWQQTTANAAAKTNNDSAMLTVSTNKATQPTDSAGKMDTATRVAKPAPAKDTVINKKTTVPVKQDAAPAETPLKNYLVWTAYCFLAAAAGVRFINNIMDSVIKDRQIANLKDQNAETEKQKQEAEAKKAAAEQQQREAEAQKAIAEKQKEMLSMQNKVNLQEAEKTVVAAFVPAPQADIQPRAMPVIGPITHADDPQKGRFGGKREVNNKRLEAAVIKSSIPLFYNVIVWVETTDGQPLKGDVIMYLHDSFADPVRVIKEEEFTEGKAMVKVKAWGAFTAGAVCDNGATLLEYDLSQDERLPKEFREK